MNRPQFGPLTEAILTSSRGGPPAIISEWLSKADKPGDYAIMWAGVTQGKLRPCNWISLITNMWLSGGGGGLAVPPEYLARFLQPLAQKNGIVLVQALLDGPRMIEEIVCTLGEDPAVVKNSLSDLENLGFVSGLAGQYDLTCLGRQIVLMLLAICRQHVVSPADGEFVVARRIPWYGSRVPRRVF